MYQKPHNITKAHLLFPCACSPQKLTPVFPWEVERVKLFLATLVDDLLDRAKVTYSIDIRNW